MKKILIRVLAAIMVAAFCFPIVSCTNQPPDETTATEATQAVTSRDPLVSEEDTRYDANGYWVDDLPELDFNQREISILCWIAEKTEFIPTEDEADIVNDAIKRRNDGVESRLGVTLKFTEIQGSNSYVTQFAQNVQTNLNDSLEQKYDVVATYSRSAGKCATLGLLRNLNDVDHINLEQPWYPSQLTESLKINNRLYFVSGDASVNSLYLMYTVYFNKELIADRQLENPQELVANKQWTIAKLIEMTEDTYYNLDGDDVLGGQGDLDDFYGFCTIYYGVDAFYTGSGLKLVDTTPDPLLKISADYTSEKTITLSEMLSRWLTSDNCNVTTGQYRQPFVNGNALFCQERCYLAENYLIGRAGKEGVDFTYGVLPTPLYDENQDNYITCLGNPFTLYCISKACPDPDIAGAVIECWSSLSYRLTTPALFEVNMQLKYAKDEVDAQMFDICKSTITTDLGRVFSSDLEKMSEIWSNAVVAGVNWKTRVANYSVILNKKIGAIVKELQNNE